MSCDVFLVSSSASPPEAQFAAVARAAIESRGAQFGPDGVDVTTPQGEEFELYSGGMFSMHGGFGQETCMMIFEAAKATNAYIVATNSSDAVAFRVEGTTGSPPSPDFPPVVIISRAEDLCAKFFG